MCTLYFKGSRNSISNWLNHGDFLKKKKPTNFPYILNYTYLKFPIFQFTLNYSGETSMPMKGWIREVLYERTKDFVTDGTQELGEEFERET